MSRECTFEGCAQPRVKLEWCGRHYHRWRRTGDPAGLYMRRLPAREVERLRVAVGLPPDGPSREWHQKQDLVEAL